MGYRRRGYHVNTGNGLINSKKAKLWYVGCVGAVMFLPMFILGPIMGIFTIPFGAFFLLMLAVST
jgi:hypothetical protein